MGKRILDIYLGFWERGRCPILIRAIIVTYYGNK